MSNVVAFPLRVSLEQEFEQSLALIFAGTTLEVVNGYVPEQPDAEQERGDPNILPYPPAVSNKGTITFYKATVWELNYDGPHCYPAWQRFFANASTAYEAAEEAKTRLLEELDLDDEELSTDVSQVQTVD